MTLLIAGFLISIAIWQIRYYKGFAKKPFLRKLKKRDQQFLIRQGSRRLQMHILLGLAGGCMLFGTWFPVEISPGCWTAAWFIAILALCWAMLLACVDFISIKLFYLGEDRQDRIDQIQKDYELRALLRKELEKQAIEDSLSDRSPDSDRGDDPNFNGDSNSKSDPK